MKTLLLLLAALLVSCADRTPPRAIIPPPAVVAELDVAPVAKASQATREAVRDIGKAGQATRATARDLRAAIDRAETLAAAHADLQSAFAEIQDLAEKLTVDLVYAEEREAVALRLIDTQEEEIAKLEAARAAQSAQIRQALANEATLRKQVEALSTASDRLAIAEDKLRIWRGRALLTWFTLAAVILLGALLRRAGRFPF